MIKGDRLLRPAQVAELLNVAKKTVYRMVYDRQLRAVNIRKSLRIYESSIHQYLERKEAAFILRHGWIETDGD